MRNFKTQFMLTAITALLATGPSCGPKQSAAKPDGGFDLPMLATIRFGEPRASRQLLNGFWAVENNSWRWTRHHFELVLMPPPQAFQAGAALKFRFALPAGLIDRVHSVTLTASVGGVALPPQTYTEPGGCTFVREVPAAAFAGGGPVGVVFTTDKYFRPGEVEGRELAVVASDIGLIAK
jgi:hypothetical protein